MSYNVKVIERGWYSLSNNYLSVIGAYQKVFVLILWCFKAVGPQKIKYNDVALVEERGLGVKNKQVNMLGLYAQDQR